MSNSDLSKTRRVLFSTIGRALLVCQVVEKQLETCLTCAFGADPRMSVERILSSKKEYRKKMLGSLVRSLRTRFDVDPGFAQLLTDFLDHRNELVHNFIRMPDFDMSSLDGAGVGLRFAYQVCAEGQLVSKILSAFIHRWATSYDFKEFDNFVKEQLKYSSLGSGPFHPYLDKIIKSKGQ